MSAKRTTHAGLTLIELLMVIAIISILAATVIPSVSGNPTEYVRGAARIVAQDLGYARSLAVLNNSTYRVTFDTAANRYTLTHVGTNTSYNTLPANPFAGPGGATTEQVTDFDDLPLLQGASVSLHSVKAGTVSVTTLDFGPLGNTSRTDETVVWLTSGSGDAQRYVAVRVNPVTGLVSVDAIQASSPSSTGGSSSSGSSGSSGSGSSGSGSSGSSGPTGDAGGTSPPLPPP